MEIRYAASGLKPLAIKVFYSDEDGFEVASVIVTGKKDAVLIDAQWTLSNAHRVISEILETGRTSRRSISPMRIGSLFRSRNDSRGFPES